LLFCDVTYMRKSQVSARIGIPTLVVLILCFSVSAQIKRQTIDENAEKTGRGSIRGQVVLPGGAFVIEAVKVTLQTLRETVSVVYTENQGQFEFPGLEPGNYKVEVEGDRQRFELNTESVQVFKGAPSIVTLTLKEKVSSEKVTIGAKTASVAELGQSIPSGAKKEFDKASKAAHDGKTEEAIAHLQKAIGFYPGFVMAHNDLGTHLLGLGKSDEAATEFRKAIALDDKAFNPKLNLGIVLVQQHKFAEAANILNGALALESGSPAARLYSGLALLALGNLTAAERDLQTAYQRGGAHYALALFHLGQLYMSKGNQALALQSFERYLNDEPNAGNADQVRKLIAMLRQPG
jgi:Tfp pilus assembly protein PilF